MYLEAEDEDSIDINSSRLWVASAVEIQGYSGGGFIQLPSDFFM